MPKFKNLKAVRAEELKLAYEEDLKKTPTSPGVVITEHVHDQVAKFCNETSVVGTITYDVIDLQQLNDDGCPNTARFLMDKLEQAGVRPDTPFHNNDEQRYPPQGAVWYRYVELNAIGGGMRLIYDSVTPALFLSCHYSYPARVMSGAGALGNDFATYMATLRSLFVRLRNHSEGVYGRFLEKDNGKSREDRREELALGARLSPMFITWLGNKNSAQNKELVLDHYNLKI